MCRAQRLAPEKRLQHPPAGSALAARNSTSSSEIKHGWPSDRTPTAGPIRVARIDMGEREQEDEPLTLQQAARLLNVARGTIIRWADLGLLPAVTTEEGQRGFRRSDLEAIRIEMGDEPD